MSGGWRCCRSMRIYWNGGSSKWTERTTLDIMPEAHIDIVANHLGSVRAAYRETVLDGQVLDKRAHGACTC